MTILDGKKTAQEVRLQLKEQVAECQAKYGTSVTLAVILVGDYAPSQTYVANKIKACAEVGIASRCVRLPQTAEDADIAREIAALNADPQVHGVMLQLPLPPQCHQADLLVLIDPRKDVDGLHEVQRGRLFEGLPCLAPCTPLGVMRLLKAYHVPVAGKHAVVVGRSNLVGKPLAMMLLAADATVTICHSRTPDLAAVCRTADILAVAVGRPNTITADMVKPGAVVVDVGITRTEAGIKGDVDFAAVGPLCSYITPVPGGVGPMTVAMLLSNTLAAYRMQMEN